MGSYGGREICKSLDPAGLASAYIMLMFSQVKGVYGPSVMCVHKPLNLVQGFVIDMLHCMFLGVSLQFIRLWFDGSNQGNPWYTGEKIAGKFRSAL